MEVVTGDNSAVIDDLILGDRRLKKGELCDIVQKHQELVNYYSEIRCLVANGLLRLQCAKNIKIGPSETGLFKRPGAQYVRRRGGEAPQISAEIVSWSEDACQQQNSSCA
ncbi:hypothetical protein Trydic_g20794 [Trypoxylus dichotomus]